MFLLRNRYAMLAIAAAVLVGGVAYFRVYAGAVQESTPAAAMPAAAVDVAMVQSRRVTDWHDYSGRLQAIDEVVVRPLVSGTLTKVHFSDGSLVNKGDVLFTIDPRPYQAAVDHAKALVASAQASVAYTGSELARGKRLLENNAIAKRDYEEKRNASRGAIAELQAARASLESAELNLEHTSIVAPISGRVSRAEVTPGNVVTAGAGSAPLTSLVSVSRLYASFDVDEQSFLKFVNPARVSGAAHVPVYLGLANEENYPRTGKLASVDNTMDTSSGTIRVRAVFDNPDGTLVPGLYARIRLGGGAPHEAVLIDDRAIGTDQNKRFVVVVDESNKTAYREVELGVSRKGWSVVEAGLRAGERIVVNGLQRVRPGDVVAPRTVQAAEPPQLVASEAVQQPAQSADKS
ncbi:efflux transporter periplasmic adaptor subunit [Pollutimonas nitritireducens]|uniref:Efflux transporter periplasmic adaptor subunit n=1 Tax=Pollutimonas nitritireducens TaxID=2045209 RepID=A0A2N4UAM2_9BURK|nr:efflux RND transporter periplasmic adaptor subunit [Pollutimonas nitritireducens]PLC52053.1 efflux transporter periplasmic adaptor subunit [Pollutimonas nitritireducens]